MPMAGKGLVKLLEEIGELGQVAAKRLAYMTTDHPDGTNLNQRLEHEIADVMAACDLVMETLDLDYDAVGLRRKLKRTLFREWHEDQHNNGDSFEAHHD